MKKIVLSVFILFSMSLYAGQQAVTDTGDIVILNDDGTWSHKNKAQALGKIGTNSKKFTTPKSASFLLKSKKNDSAFWLDTSKWSFTKAGPEEATEYAFQLKGQDLYAMAITEAVPIPLDSLGEIALENARSVAPNTKVHKKEYRHVNGKKVLYMKFSGTIQGIDFTYIGYYYSDKKGSTQFLTYTGSNLISNYNSDIHDLLNGLITQSSTKG